jgi:hypothetical protein
MFPKIFRAAKAALFVVPLIVVAQTPSVSNLSTRAQVGAGADAIFAGFNISGTDRKTILIRAVGPTLGAFGVAGTLADPKLELYSNGTKINENDDWGTAMGAAAPISAATFASVGAFGLTEGSRDAALLVTLAAGSYSAVVSGVNNSTGVALIEIYEIGASSSRLTNISARAQVGTGSDILIPGLVISPGTGIRRLLIRAAGPSLGALGVGGALANPTLVVLDAKGATVASNNNWGTPTGTGASTATVLSDAFGKAGAFSFASGGLDSALIADIGPGNYTIQASGVNNTRGIALVEVYDITPTAAATFQSVPLTLESLYGTYRHEPMQNGYHLGTIALKPGAGANPTLQWKNSSNVAWNLEPDLAQGILRTDSTNPYQDGPTGRDFTLLIRNGEVAGFFFQNAFFAREGAAPVVILTPQFGGLSGNIGMSMPQPPASHSFGFSFYVTVWSLVESQFTNFQIGLPSTWVVPNNDDFFQPLLPPGNLIREISPERASSYWRGVFQTIEGGLGYWGSTRFVSATPKYRINGTPNGYEVEISSPGWGFGKTTALEREAMGIAQLSNRILIPPDGLTLREGTSSEILGNAWMALPFTPAKAGGLAPIGNQSWTLFLNSANFKGPVAFWIPDTWTRLSRTYTIIQGQGLDVKTAQMGGGSMEVNTVPHFVATDSKGVKYTRVPKLLFPPDSQGLSYLLQDVRSYAKSALFDSVNTWFNGGAAPTGEFAAAGVFKPVLSATRLNLRQGPTGSMLPITGWDTYVQSTVITTPDSTAIALRWTGNGTPGVFPQYFKQEGTAMQIITADQVPAETKLAEQVFATGRAPVAYTSPDSGLKSWLSPAPPSGPHTAALNDGSVVTYYWYRFADQPSLQGLGWTESEKEQLQAKIEKIHVAWRSNAQFMAPPSRGSLASLDAALLVTPPPGLEIGYVPIVTRQDPR